MRNFLIKSCEVKMERVLLVGVVCSLLSVHTSVSAYNLPLETKPSSLGTTEDVHSRHRQRPGEAALVQFRSNRGNYYVPHSSELDFTKTGVNLDDNHRGRGLEKKLESQRRFRANLNRHQRSAPYNAKSQMLVTKLSDMGEDFIETLSDLVATFLESDIPSMYTNMSTEEIFRSYVQAAKNVIRTSSKSVLSIAISRISDLQISSDCLSSLVRFILDIKDLDLWTIRMLDAWAKPSPGIWMGTTAFLGSYDECLDITHHPTSAAWKGITIHGQDCLVEISMHPELKPLPRSHNLTIFTGDGWKWSRFIHMLFSSKTFGRLNCLAEICVPSLCTPQDVTNILNTVSDAVKLIQIKVLSCESKQDHRWTPLQIIFGIVVGVLFLLVCLGTAAHRALGDTKKEETDNQQDKTPIKQIWRFLRGLAVIVSCFSLWHPVNKLWLSKTEGAQSKTLLPGITGFKALLMAMIIFGHTHVYTFLTSSKDYLLLIQSFRERVFYHGIVNMSLLVDTFFVITGMLSGFAFTGRIKGLRAAYLIPAFIYRYLRIMPSFLGALGLLYLLPRVATGPKAAYVRRAILAEDTCRDSWWKMLLAIHNTGGRGEVQDCLPFTWYVAVDLQLWVLFLVPLFLLGRWPKRAAVIFGAMALASLAYSFYVLERNFADIHRKYDNARYLDAFIRVVSDSHWFPFPHVITYTIGIGLGYVTWFYREIKLHKEVQVMLWIAALVSIFLVLWGTFNLREYLGSLEPAPKAHWLSYLLVRRAAWSLANSWILFALVSGRARALTHVLESRVLCLLGRMSLSMYVVHVFVIVARLSLLRGDLSTNHYQMVCEFILNFVFSVLLSLVFFALVECPFTKLTDLALTVLVKTFGSASEKANFNEIQLKGMNESKVTSG